MDQCGGDAIRQYWTTERMQSAEVEKNDCIETIPGKKQFQAAAYGLDPTVVPDETRLKHPYNTVGALFYSKTDIQTQVRKDFHATAYVVNTGKGDNILFTAAHNLESAKGIAEDIYFVPARLSDGDKPYGSFSQMPGGKGKAWFVPEEWGKDGKRPVGYDFGAITLCKNKEGKNVGKVVQPLNYMVDLKYSKESEWRIIGYPDDNKMCESYGDFIEIDQQYIVHRTNPVLDGMSGGPWMLQSPDDKSYLSANGAHRGGINGSTCAYFRQTLIDAVVNQIKK